jgi:hypothetical protein
LDDGVDPDWRVEIILDNTPGGIEDEQLVDVSVLECGGSTPLSFARRSKHENAQIRERAECNSAKVRSLLKERRHGAAHRREAGSRRGVARCRMPDAGCKSDVVFWVARVACPPVCP